MNTYNHTYYSSFSAEKTDISSQLDNTQRMIKDLKTLKKQANLYQMGQNLVKFKSFHKNSIRSLVHSNFKNKMVINSDEKEEKAKVFLPECKRNKKLKFNQIYNETSYNIPFYNKILSNNSLLSLSSSRIKRRTFSNNFKSMIRSRNKKKIVHTSNFSLSNSKNNLNSVYFSISNLNDKIDSKNKKIKNSNHIRTESISQFYKKSKELVYSNYINNIQKAEYRKLNEGIKTKIELYDVEIFSLQQSINLIEKYMKDDEKYIEYLKKELLKETEKNELLLKKKNEGFTENFLLNHRLQKIERIYRKNINNKFFLLCVKNGTNQIDKFTEEDKNDYLLDLDTLNQLSNFSVFEKKINNQISKQEDEKLSVDEIEIIVFGRKLIRKPKIIFNSPEEFGKKLNKIESNIQNSLIEFNQSQNTLNLYREEYKEKLDLIEKDYKIDIFYQNEMNKYYEKLNEVKTRNEYLKKYVKNIKFKNRKHIQLELIEDKIFEVFINIEEKYRISVNRNFNEKITTITYLRDLERGFNKLVKIKNSLMLNHHSLYLEIKKNIDKEHRIAKIKELKEKVFKDFDEKINKVLTKSCKLIVKQRRKINRIHIDSLKHTKLNQENNNNDSDDYEYII